jgi:hypothetical protein
MLQFQLGEPQLQALHGAALKGAHALPPERDPPPLVQRVELVLRQPTRGIFDAGAPHFVRIPA